MTHNPLKIVVLTTRTHHHTYFVQEFIKVSPLTCVLIETKIISVPFKTLHPFESAREEYERKIYFNDLDVRLEDFVTTYTFESVNDAGASTLLKEISPDIVIVFGTGKLGKIVVDICPDGIINLHGGDPEEYRGLDSHLWAIYHNDFTNLISTLHCLNEKFDDGDIILQAPIELYKGMAIHELRRFNTEICIKLVFSALDIYKRYGRFISRPQRRRGRYYSHMPAPLKEICTEKFQKYTDSLK